MPVNKARRCITSEKRVKMYRSRDVSGRAAILGRPRQCRHRDSGMMVRLAAGSVVVGVLFVGGCAGEEPKRERIVAVTEVTGSPKAEPTHLLSKERRFTYLDTAYGKCLDQNGVKDLPPLDEPLKLDETDPAVARALQACQALAIQEKP